MTLYIRYYPIIIFFGECRKIVECLENIVECRMFRKYCSKSVPGAAVYAVEQHWVRVHILKSHWKLSWITFTMLIYPGKFNW